jgi:glycerol-3-phosphate dehydrogenase
MWERGWRDDVWSQLDRQWDLIVIGGGITGAGILREAARAGLRVLLLEAGDFSSGTSSRSSKLVHGGLRYLANGQIRTTLDSVRERERLLREGRGLIQQTGFLIPGFRGDRIPHWVFGVGLTIYDLLALRWGHRHYGPQGLLSLCPQLSSTGLLGGYRYFDAETDDARLVLRLIREAVREGGTALNYARVERLLRQNDEQVCGVVALDRDPAGHGRATEVRAPVVINATGAWADDLRREVGGAPRLRRLRGSHLFFPYARLPLTRAVSLLHPRDGRPVFVVPWEGVTLIGTTDVDHLADLGEEPTISPEEAQYLLDPLRLAFPALDLQMRDVRSTLAGVRPVVDTGKANPSKESREHVLWDEHGLVTITGGKLTTFRLMAHLALRSVRKRLPGRPRFDARLRVLDEPPPERCIEADLPPATCTRLVGRYGIDAPRLLGAAQPGELATVGDSLCLWAELRWAARDEGVVHLDDLLLRRVRLGLLSPEGGLPFIDRIRRVVQPELGWDDRKWEAEVTAYENLWRRSYAPPS